MWRCFGGHGLRLTANPMRISVVIPTHDEAQAIGSLLQDLASARAAGHELIVVDGGSQDGTVAIAERSADRVLTAATGRASQMNAGANAASGQILWFLHADTRVPTHAIQSIIDAIDAGLPWGRFDVSLSGSSWAFRIIESMMNLRSCFTAIATGDQGIFVTRELFNRLGGFPNQPLMEDVAISRQLRKHRKPACIRNARLQTSSRRWEQNGTLQTIWLMWRLRLRYWLGADPAALARRYR